MGHHDLSNVGDQEPLGFIDKILKISMSAHFATAIIYCYMLQWHALTPLYIACICQEVAYTGAATTELFTTILKRMTSSHPHPWPHSGIGVSSSSLD